MKKKIKIPKFRNEAEERKFWSRLDLSEYFDKDDFDNAIFCNIKPTTRAISLRLPEYLMIRVKEHANELNVPYQSLLKKYIAHGLACEK